jgi:hypothetical protein
MINDAVLVIVLFVPKPCVSFVDVSFKLRLPVAFADDVELSPESCIIELVPAMAGSTAARLKIATLAAVAGNKTLRAIVHVDALFY